MASVPAVPAHASSPHHLDTSTGLDSRKMAFWCFIGAESLLFAALIGSYLAYKGASLTPPFPHDTVLPNGQVVKGILNIPLTSVSTFVLLTSSYFMVLALAAIQRGDQRWGTVWLFATALAGSVFLGFQAYEFTHFVREGLTLRSNLFGATFYMLTGCHGLHVLVGVIYLLTLGVLGMRGRLGPEKSLNVEIAGLYWHFVDIVWVIIFPVVYLIP